MKTSKDIRIEEMEKLAWHYQNCDIEWDNGRAWDLDHKLDVTDGAPDMPEPDPYDNWQENDLLEK